MLFLKIKTSNGFFLHDHIFITWCLFNKCKGLFFLIQIEICYSFLYLFPLVNLIFLNIQIYIHIHIYLLKLWVCWISLIFLLHAREKKVILNAISYASKISAVFYVVYFKECGKKLKESIHIKKQQEFLKS